MLSTTGKEFAVVDKYCEDYGNRVRELKKQGRKIIGYLCAYVPLEIIAATGFIPFRIRGNAHEPITKADTQMETIACSLVRSCFDAALKGNYSFLDGLVLPHSCDSVCRTYDIWKYNLGLPYSHLVDVPHSTDNLSLDFFKAVLDTFRKSLERFAGKKISDEELTQAIQVYNQSRAKVRELYELRKMSPPLISGTEVCKVLIATTSIPVEESIELLDNVIDEVRARDTVLSPKSARIMVVGAEVDDMAFIKLIEDSGANIVADYLCPGAREYEADVELTQNPIDGIAERYLRKINCARTYRDKNGDYEEYLEKRFGHINHSIKDFKVDGVILYFYRYCDPYGFEVPAMKSYIESKGTPVLYLEDEYSMTAISRLRTRIQAFLEMIG